MQLKYLLIQALFFVSITSISYAMQPIQNTLKRCYFTSLPVEPLSTIMPYLDKQTETNLMQTSQYVRYYYVPTYYYIPKIQKDFPTHNLTPLHVATFKNNKQAATFLLTLKSIDVNQPFNEIFTPLYIAAERGYHELVELLLARNGILINTHDTYTSTPLYLAARNNHEKVIALLIKESKIKVNIPFQKFLPLFAAVHANCAAAVKELLTYSGDIGINEIGPHEYTPLYVAVKKGYIEIVKHLLERPDILVNKKSKNKTPLYLATKKRCLQIMSLLCTHNHNSVNIPCGPHKLSPLHIACKKTNSNVVSILLKTPNINVNALTSTGKTALDIALKRHTTVDFVMQEDSFEIIQLLLKNYALTSESLKKYRCVNDI